MTSDEQMLIEAARKFAARVVEPGAVLWEAERRIGAEALPEAAELGLTGIQVPREYGGQAASFACKAQIAAALAGADFGFAMSLINTHNVAVKLATEGSADLAARFVPALLRGERLGSVALTEPHAGSDFPAITTCARAEGEDWLIDGEKAWIVNAAMSDVLIVYAHTRSGAVSESGSQTTADIAAFVVDARQKGFERLPAFRLSGQHTIGTGGFRLAGYRANGAQMLQAPGLAFKAALQSINGARIYIAAMCCGMVERSIEIVGQYGASRHTFGKPLGGHQGWRWVLAEAAAELAAAQALVEKASAAVDAGTDTPALAANAKVFATRMAQRQLPALGHAMGAEGLRESLPIGRHICAAGVASLVDGSTEMLLERIAAKWRPATR